MSMATDRFFCAEASCESGESMYGTVARIRSWLLLEYPGAWRRRAVEDSRLLSGAVKRHLGQMEDGGQIDRSLLIRREHTRGGPAQCFFIRSCDDPPRIHRRVLSRYEDLLNMNAGGDSVEGLLYAVCTHGRHDKCCAKFGMPLYCALREVIADRVWECSHVGGDRFAGNVVVFPYGLYFGRVTPDEAPELVRRCEAGQIWLERYRGRSCFPRSVQVAEYFVRAESGRTGIAEFQPREASRDDAITRVHFQARSDGSFHTVEFARQPDGVSHLLTCGATEPSAAPQYELIRYTVST
jgi:hypothetical protein